MRLSIFVMANGVKNMIVDHEMIRKCLSGFNSVDFGKTKIVIKDPTFHAMPYFKQEKLVLEKLPSDIRNEIELELVPMADEDDNTIKCLELKDIKNLELGDKLPITAQWHLDYAVHFLKKKESVLASEAAWKSASLVLQNFLLFYGYMSKNHSVKSDVVSSLAFFSKEILKDEVFSKNIATSWSALEASHANSYNNQYSLIFVVNWIQLAVSFSQYIVQIHTSKHFKKEYLDKWMQKGYKKRLCVMYEGEWTERQKLPKNFKF